MVPLIERPGFASDEEDTYRRIIDLEKCTCAREKCAHLTVSRHARGDQILDRVSARTWRSDPLDDLDSPKCAKIIADGQRRWREVGSVSLPGFVREEMREPMARECSDLEAFRRLYTASAYTKTLEAKQGLREELGPSHPANRLLQMDIHAVAGDLLPRTLMLRQLYDSPQLARFFARVLGVDQETVYQYHDPWQCINLMYQRDAGQRSWHYDGSECARRPRGALDRASRAHAAHLRTWRTAASSSP